MSSNPVTALIVAVVLLAGCQEKERGPANKGFGCHCNYYCPCVNCQCKAGDGKDKRPYRCDENCRCGKETP